MDLAGAVAAVDESQRAGRHLLTVAWLPLENRIATAKHLRTLRLAGERRIHFKAENAQRRRSILSAMVSIEWLAATFAARKPRGCTDAQVRQALLHALLAFCDVLPDELILEQRSKPEDRLDRHYIGEFLARSGQSLRYRHDDPNTEPLLWLPDMVAWCVGRDRHWQERLPPSCRTVRKVALAPC